MDKKNIIRVGDCVILIDPRPIIKIGYDRDVESIYEEMKDDPRILTFCVSLKLHERDVESVIRAVSRSVLSSSLRSGTQRKIFYGDTREDLCNQSFYVVSKHVRKTGNYYGPSGGYNYWGEYDYDPGGLNNEQSHTILELSEYMSELCGPVDYTSGLYVCSTQVIKCTQEEASK